MVVAYSGAPTRAHWLALALAAVALLGVLVSGCASTTTITRAPTVTPAATYPPFPTPTPTPPPPILTLKQAWGDARITKLPLRLPGSAQFTFENAATPDGHWLVGEVAPPEGSLAFTPYLALYNIATRAIKRVHALQTPKSGVVGATADGDWLAWSETSGMAPGPWSLNTYNLRNGAFRRVISGSSTETVAGWASAPVASHGMLIWSQLGPFRETTTGDGYKHVAIRLMQLATGKVATLAMSANNATISWPWAGWGAQTDAEGDSYLQFVNLATGQTARLNQDAGLMALDGAMVVFGFSPGQLVMAPDLTQPTVTQRVYFAPEGAEATQATVTDRLIAWFAQSDTPLPQVFDRLQRTYVMLPVGYAVASFAWTGGNLLVWTSADSKPDATGSAISGALNVVNTSALPAAPPA